MKRFSGYVELPEGADPLLGIEAVWLSLARQTSAHRVLPDGRCDIILRFAASTGPIKHISVSVTGPTTAHYDVPVEPGMGFAGIVTMSRLSSVREASFATRMAFWRGQGNSGDIFA